MEKAKKIWMDGKMVPWDKAQVHILTHTLHYGLGVFEGIRCYHCTDGRSAIFRLPEHVERLFDSARAMEMDIPFTQEKIREACCQILRVNGMKDGYIRPLVFIGDGVMGLHPMNNPIRLSIIAWKWGAYLGDEGLKKGIRAKVSSYTRHHVNVMMTKTKTSGNYVNSILAKREVTRDGYDEAIMLDTAGYVSEASGENIFMVKRGRIKTPPLTSILPGITRDSVLAIARDLGLEVIEQRFTRDELYLADEAFFSGTAAEITPIREVDNRRIGEGRPGPLTRKIQEIFFKAVKGADDRYRSWLTTL
ncbi:MAG TPA: branched-chain amino acid transaminase [Thermodesulfobacteriota bacterium]|nr:branched-chain amino acid transaminase [Thermodesulfobacteriota bacterium]